MNSCRAFSRFTGVGVFFLCFLFAFQVSWAKKNELAQGSGGSTKKSAAYSALPYTALGEDFDRGQGLQQARIKCTASGSFKWLYFHPPPPYCTTSLGNAEFYEVLDNSFNKCVASGARAAGMPSASGNFTGIVQHKGFIGDTKHAQSASLHNVGRAVDINRIEVNGVVMDYEKAVSQYHDGSKEKGPEFKFFQAFRECWSQAARDSNARCKRRPNTSAGFFGSLGWDDESHQHHLHISLPVCDQGNLFRRTQFTAPLRSLEAFMSLISSPVQATEPEAFPIRRVLSSGETVTGNAEFIGEPVSEPVLVKMEIKCADGTIQPLEKRLMVCDYVGFKEDLISKKMTLTFSMPEFNEEDGRIRCGPSATKIYDNPCGATK